MTSVTPVSPHLSGTDRPRSHTWNPRPVAPVDLGVALVAGAGALVAVVVPLAVLAAVEKHTGAPVPEPVKSAVVPFALVIGGVLFWLLLRRRGWTWADLGFHRLGRRGWHLAWQIPVGVAGSLVVMTIGAGALLGMEPADDSTLDDGFVEAGAGWVLVALACYLLIGPVLEEIAFRRLLMGWLDRVGQRWLGRAGAVVASTLLSSVAFGLVHVSAPVVLWTSLLGLCCALVTRWHGSLWAGFLFHLANNAIASAALIAALFTG